MPTLNLGAPSTSGYWSEFNGAWTSGTPSVGRDSYNRYRPAGLRWGSLAIPQGATITSASLTLTVSNDVRNGNATGFHQVDNAPALATGQATTTHSPYVSSPQLTAGTHTLDLTASLQALINRAGWASGNAAVIRVEGNRFADTWANLTGISLTIEYVDPTIPVDGTAHITMGATATAARRLATTGTPAALTMGAAGGAVARRTTAGTAALTLGAAGDVTVQSGPVGVAALTMGATGDATLRESVQVAGTAALTLGAVAAPAAARLASAAASIVMGAAAVARSTRQATAAAALALGAGAAVSTRRIAAGIPYMLMVSAVSDGSLPFPGWQWLIKTSAYRDAVQGRSPDATMTVDVLDPTGTTILDTFGGAAIGRTDTRPGFENVAIHHRGASGKVRWSAELTTRDPGLFPREGDLLDPLTHNQVRCWWWIRTREYGWQPIPVGTGTVDLITITDDQQGYALRILVKDLMEDIARARWDTSIPLALTPLSEAQGTILADRAPWAAAQIPATIEMTPEDWAHGGPDSSPADDLARLAYAAGAVAHADRMGVYTTSPIVARDQGPVVARFVEGQDARLIAVSNATIDMNAVCNAVTFRSASSDVDPPVWGSWQIDDPSHPLWVGKRRYSRDMSNALMRTAGQCVTAAQNYVRANSVVQTITIEHTPRPDLDAGQAVEVTRPRAGVTGRFTVVEWDLPRPSGNQTTVLEAERMWF